MVQDGITDMTQQSVCHRRHPSQGTHPETIHEQVVCVSEQHSAGRKDDPFAYESPLGTPLPCYNTANSFPRAPKYEQNPFDHTPPTPWTNHFCLAKEDLLIKPTSEKLDADGFSPTERRKHKSTVRYLTGLRLVASSRLLIRGLSLLVSATAFILIIVTIILFTRFHSSHTDLRPFDTDKSKQRTLELNYTPTKFFASISAISTTVSLALNVLCCLIPRLRKITPLSNLIFTIISVVGFAGWLAGCMYLDHGGARGNNPLSNLNMSSSRKTNFWYFVCDAATDMQLRPSSSTSSQSTTTPTDTTAAMPEFVRFCRYTTHSWNLGVTQMVLEGLTLVNVVVAWFLVKSGTFRAARG